MKRSRCPLVDDTRSASLALWLASALGAAMPQQVSGRYDAVGRAPGYATLASL
jgi:hypothetical protein